MGLFFSLLHIAFGPTIRQVSYESSDEAMRNKIKTGMRNKIIREIDKGFNYNHKALNEDGSVSLYIQMDTDFIDYEVRGWDVYRLSDADHADLMTFYRSVLTNYVTHYNESAYDVPHRPTRNYKLSLRHLWPPNHGKLQFLLRIVYIPPTSRETELRPVLTPYVARQLVRSLPSGSTCPVTYEPYTELAQLCVGFCGHVFSPVVASQESCPLCRSPTGWTTVRQLTHA